MKSRFRVVLATPVAVVIACAGARAVELPVVGTGDGIEVLRVVGAAYSADNPQTTVLVPPPFERRGSGGWLQQRGARAHRATPVGI